MRCSIGQTWTGSTCDGTATNYTFDQATVPTSTFANYSDWRLPSPWELSSLVDYSIPYPSSTINSTIFPNTPNSRFWSGHPYAPVPAYACFVDFSYGYTSASNKPSSNHVRLVRSGQFFDPLPVVITPTWTSSKPAVASGGLLRLRATATYSDGSSRSINPTDWTTTLGTINQRGELTAGNVTSDTPITVTARYSEGSQTLTARYTVIVQAVAVPKQLTAEVIANINAQNLTKLQLWFNTDSGAAVRNRAGRTFKLYVAALLPSGSLVSTPTLFLLNRSKEWQALSWPLVEYLSGVNAGDWQLIELLDGVDTSLLAGAQILVGYGESDTEMLEAGRYSVVYQLP